MTRIVRLFLLVFVLGLAVPALAPPRAAAAGGTLQTDVSLPRPIVKPAMKWLKDNWKMLYIAFDELIDDLTGCACEPPSEPPPGPTPEPQPQWN
jgi:hypothetical protein